MISHHYDVSNRFYEMVLGPSMAYTCAVFPKEEASLEEAQAEKFDLVARKLGLERGMRLVESLPGVDAVVVDAAGKLHFSSGLLDGVPQTGPLVRQ